jgi:hypothetical protein
LLKRRLGAAGRVPFRDSFSVKAMVAGSRAVYGRMLRREPVPGLHPAAKYVPPRVRLSPSGEK